LSARPDIRANGAVNLTLNHGQSKIEWQSYEGGENPDQQQRDFSDFDGEPWPQRIYYGSVLINSH